MLCHCLKSSASKDDKDEVVGGAPCEMSASPTSSSSPSRGGAPVVVTNEVGERKRLKQSKSFTNRPLNGANKGASAAEQNLEWMNYILSSTWPRFRSAGNIMGKKILEAALTDTIKEQKESGILDIDVVFSLELDIGENPPVFSALRSYHTGHDETEGVEVDLAMSFKPKDSWNFKCEVNGTYGHFPISCEAGVSYFEISGVCSMILTPLLDVFPVFGGGQIFFLDTPTVKMEFSGMKGLKTLAPLIMSTLRSAVVKNLQTQVVLPNSKFIPVRNIPLDTRVDLTSPLPEGVLQVTVHAAKGLKASDFNLIGQRTSDPKIEVQIGAAKFSTRSIKKTLNPVWEPAHVGYLFIHNPNQALNVEVFDADLIGDKDFLAYLDGMSIIDALDHKGEWFDLVPAPPGPGEPALTQEEMHPSIRLGLEYLEVSDLPPNHHRDHAKPVTANSTKSHMHGGPRNLDVDHVGFLRILSVRLLGLDCDELYAQQLWHSSVSVTKIAGPAPWSDDKVVVEETKNYDDIAKNTSSMNARRSDGDGATSWLAKATKGVASIANRLVSAEDTTRETRKSQKAKLWGAAGGPVGAKGAGIANVPAQVQLMIERLALQKHMPVEEIAEIANMDVETVQLLIDLRREFKVVWHQALHFWMEHPGHSVELEVKTIDGLSLGKVEIDLLRDLAGETSLRRKVKMGTETIPDVVFEFEVELRGLTHSSITVPDGFRRGASTFFKQHHTEHTAVQIGG